MTRRRDNSDPMRVGRWLILGFVGIVDMLRDYTFDGGLISDEDYDKLVLYHDKIGKVIEHHTMHTPGAPHDRRPDPGTGQ